MGEGGILERSSMCACSVSPFGEFLSLLRQRKEPKKGGPTSLPFGSPIGRARPGAPPTRPGKAHKTRLAAELGHGSAFSPAARTQSAALKGEKPQGRARVPLVCRREAQPPEAYDLSWASAHRKSESPCGGKRGRVSELRSRPRCVWPARASSGHASGGEHRRGAEGRHTRGRLFFGYFRKHALACFPIDTAATQKKVTRPQAKSEAAAITADCE